jgi:hypothetical protein
MQMLHHASVFRNSQIDGSFKSVGRTHHRYVVDVNTVRYTMMGGPQAGRDQHKD